MARRGALLPLLLLAAAGVARGGVIDTIVVFMLENRSFDHLLGLLKKLDPRVDGCLPGAAGCDQPMDPADPESPRVPASDGGLYVSESDPDHSVSGTTFEVFGRHQQPPWPSDPPMSGFVKQYDRGNVTDHGRHIMKCFDPEQIPAIVTLAQEFALFDRWFVSVPGPTMPNRAFSMSGTSHGIGTNDVEKIVLGWPQKTIFRALEEAGRDWRVYFQEVPTPLAFRDVRTPGRLAKFRLLDAFKRDAAAGDLPDFSWVDPRYFGLTKAFPATDQHPNHPVDAGDRLIKEVYEAVRNGPKWNSTLLLITYDEHGGWWDHVAPPPAPSPDGRNSTDDPFDFTRLGVRVPTVAVSPWVKKGTLIRRPGSGGTAPGAAGAEFDATSAIATIRELYGMPAPLTARDAWAASFAGALGEAEPRGDCPTELPTPPDHAELLARRGKSLPSPDTAPLNHLQRMLADFVRGLPVGGAAAEAGDVPATEAAAGRWVLDRITAYLAEGTGARSAARAA